MDLNDRNVLITGANRGLGAALVGVALEQGAAKVYAAARDLESLTEVCALDSARVFPVRMDMTAPDQIEAAASRTGDVDVLLSNAGVTCFAPILGSPGIEDFRQAMEVNYFGTMNLVRSFSGQLRERRGGILLILSMAAVALSRSAPGYSASKAAALMLGSSIREELREDGVGVTVSLPGWIDTDMAAGFSGDKASPREVAEASLRALHNGDEVVWPDPFARIVRELVQTRMLDLLTTPRSVMNDAAARFTARP